MLLIDDGMAWTSIEDAGGGQWRVRRHRKGPCFRHRAGRPRSRCSGLFLTDGCADYSAGAAHQQRHPRVKLLDHTSRARRLSSRSAVAMTSNHPARVEAPAGCEPQGGRQRNSRGRDRQRHDVGRSATRFGAEDALTVVASPRQKVTAAPSTPTTRRLVISRCALWRTVNITAAPFDTYDYTPAMRTADDANTAKLVKFGVVAKRGTFTSAERFTQEIFMLFTWRRRFR